MKNTPINIPSLDFTLEEATNNPQPITSDFTAMMQSYEPTLVERKGQQATITQNSKMMRADPSYVPDTFEEWADVQGRPMLQSDFDLYTSKKSTQDAYAKAKADATPKESALFNRDSILGGGANILTNLITGAGVMGNNVLGFIPKTDKDFFGNGPLSDADMQMGDDIAIKQRRIKSINDMAQDGTDKEKSNADQLLSLPKNQYTDEEKAFIGAGTRTATYKPKQDEYSSIKNRDEFISFLDSNKNWLNSLVDDRGTAKSGATLKSSYDAGMKDIDAGNTASGLATIISSVGTTFVDDPAAAAELLANSVPSMMFPATMFASYGADIVNNGVDAYTKVHGKAPEGKDLLKIVVPAYVTSGMDAISGKLLGESSKLITKAGAGMLRPVSKLTSIAKTTGSTAMEGVTEGLQSIGEQYVNTLDTDKIDLSQAFVEGAMGLHAGVGAHIAGKAKASIKPITKAVGDTINLVSKTASKTKDAVKKHIDKSNDVADQEAKVTDAVKAGTIPDLKGTATEKAETILATKGTTPEQRITKQAMAQQETTKVTEEAMAAFDAGDVPKAKELLAKAQELQKAVDSEGVANTNVDTINTDVDTLSSATESTEEVKEATNRIFKSMATNPESVSINQATNIANNDSLDTNTKDLANSIISNEKAIKGAQEVSSNIYEGSEEFTGLTKQVSSLGAAITLDDKSSADNSITSITEWGDQRIAENKIAQQAFIDVKAGKEDTTAIQQAKKLGLDITIDSNKTGLMTTKAAETNSILATQQLMASQYKEAFGNTIKEAPTVSNVPDAIIEDTLIDPNDIENSSNTKDTRIPILANTPTLNNKFTVPQVTEENTNVLKRANGSVANITEMDTNGEVAENKAVAQLKAFTKQVTQLLSKSTLTNHKFVNSADDPFNEFIQEGSKSREGTINEQVSDAIATASFNYLTSEASTTVINYPDDIRSILGLDEHDTVTSAMTNTLSQAGVPRANVIDSLGDSIYNMLGIKANADTTISDESKLKTALGQRAVIALTEYGYLQNNSIPQEEYEALLPKTSSNKYSTGSSEGRVVNFVRIPTTTEYREMPDGSLVERIIPIKAITAKSDIAKESNNIINKLTGAPINNIGPTTEAQKTNTKVKNSNKNVPKRMLNNLKKANANKNYIKENVNNIFSGFSDAAKLAVIGIKPTDKATTHIANIKANVASNNALMNELDHWASFIKTQDPSAPFYFTNVVWKNMRMGLTSNTINPQTSKIHRHLLANESYTIKIDMNDAVLRKHFQAAVAESLGFPVDKTTATSIEKAFNALLTDPIINAGVEAIKDINAGTLMTEAHSNSIVEAVKSGRNNVHSLDGLVALSEMQLNTPFTTNLFREVDGITNGVIIGALQFITDTGKRFADRMAKGGVFTDGTTSYGQFIEDGNLDSYQDLAKVVNTAMAHIKGKTAYATTHLKQANAYVQMLTGDLIKEGMVTKVGRNLMKPALLITNYGASMKKVMDDLGNSAIEGLYNSIEKATNAEDAIALESLRQALGFLIGDANVSFGVSPLEFELNKNQEKALKESVSASTGAALKTALMQEYGDFKDKGALVNDTFNAIYAMYDIVRKDRISNIRKTKGRDPSIEELKSIDISLDDLIPQVNTALSDPTNSAEKMSFLKTEKVRQVDNPAYIVNTAYHQRKPESDSIGRYGKQIKSIGSILETKEPGVAPAVLLVQQMDAAVQNTIMGMYNMLNIHDAQGLGLGDVEEATQEVNKAFYNLTKNYSILEETQKAYTLAKNAFNTMGYSEDLLDTAFTKINSDGSISRSIGLLEENLTNTVPKVIKERKTFLDAVTAVVQYNGGDGTAYITGNTQVEFTDDLTTEEDKFEIQSAIENTATTVNKLDQSLTPSQVEEEIKAQPSNTTVLPTKLNKSQIVGTLNSLWGQQKSMWHAINDAQKTIIKPAMKAMQSIIHNVNKGVSIQTAIDRIVDTTEPKILQRVVSRINDVLSGTPTSPKNEKVANDLKALASTFKNTKNKEAKETLVNELITATLQGESLDEAMRASSANTAIKTAVKLAFKRQMQSSTKKVDGDFTEKYKLDANNAMRTFEYLHSKGNVIDSVGHTALLANLMTNIINKIDKPLTLLIGDTDHESHGMYDGSNIYLKLANGALSNSIQMSAQEVFVHELYHSVLQALDTDSYAVRELKKLYDLASEQITPLHFLPKGISETSPTYTSELKAATERWNHIFNSELHTESKTDSFTGLKGDDFYSNYLHEFAVLGSTNKQVMDALKNVIMPPESITTSLVGKLIELANKILSLISRDILRVKGTVDTQVAQLAANIASIKQKHNTLAGDIVDKAFNLSTDAFNTLFTAIHKPLLQLANNPTIRYSKSKLIRMPARLVRFTQNHSYYEEASKVLRQVRKNTGTVKAGLMTSLKVEIGSRTKRMTPVMNLLSLNNKLIDQARMKTIGYTTKIINKAFATPLTEQESSALTKIILKTDLGSIVNNTDEAITGQYTLKKVVSIVAKKGIRTEEITKLEQEITGKFNNSIFYNTMAQNLGHFMATGKALKQHTLLNAQHIAKMVGTDGAVLGNWEDAIPFIESIATLYAIQYSSSEHRINFVKLANKELSREEDNGIMFSLLMHTQYKQDALTNNFGAQEEGIMLKGYTKELVSADAAFRVGTEEDALEFAKEGYMRHGSIAKDSTDPNKADSIIYISRNKKLTSRVAGAISMKSNRHKGSDLISIYSQQGALDPALSALLDSNIIFDAKKLDIAQIVKGTAKDVSPEENALIPLTSNNGDIVAYRYMMGEDFKDSILNKNNDFSATLAAMIAAVNDKVESKIQNERVVKYTKDAFDQDIRDGITEHVYLSPVAIDKDHREMYYQLPKETRENIRKVWGTDSLRIRKEDYDILFGYTKFSLSSWNHRDNPDAKGVYKILNELGNLYSNARGHNPKLVQIFGALGTGWGETLRVIKDVIVIKTGVVTMGNIVSNMMLLKALGLSIAKIVQAHIIVYRGIFKYQKDEGELFELEKNIELGLGNTTMQRRTKILKHELALNPVADLMTAGLYQSMVEDLDSTNEDDSQLGRVELAIKNKLGVLTKGVPKSVSDTADFLLLRHSTKSYKFMRDVAQISDFAARYALVNHLTSRKKNPLSRSDAIGRAIDVFINYEVPTHKSIQYLNDAGFAMFTKYYIRVQKVAYMLAKENPGRLATLALFQNLIGYDVPDILDSLNNPLNKVSLNPFGILSSDMSTLPISIIEGAFDQ